MKWVIVAGFLLPLVGLLIRYERLSTSSYTLLRLYRILVGWYLLLGLLVAHKADLWHLELQLLIQHCR